MTPKSVKFPTQFPEITISEQDGVRSLHLGGTMVQSAMRIAAPNDLELFYTQCMMGFLLFNPKPKRILMAGLGGGSLAKFIFHTMPEVRLTVVETNPQVVTAARQYFELPDENEQFDIVIADGGQFIAERINAADVIMIDGFDDDYQVPSLCSQEFYDCAKLALRKNGVLVVNLLSRDKALKSYLQRIENSFDGHIIAMMVETRGNLIVFAFKNNSGKHSWQTIRKQAQKLEKLYPLPFSEFVVKLQKYY